MPTFSIALSKARPIKNSSERSGNIVSDKSHPKIRHRPTVDTLLVGKCLTLLSPIPLDDQSVSERQCSTRVSRQLIAIVQRAGEGGLDMAHEFSLKLILGSKLGSRMLPPSVTPSYSHLVSSSSTPVRQRQKGKPQTHASRSGSGILASTLLISDGPKPVKVRLCLGRLNPGPTGPWRSAMGAPTEGLRSRRGSVGSDDAMVDG
jgi:hypothetical protein